MSKTIALREVHFQFSAYPPISETHSPPVATKTKLLMFLLAPGLSLIAGQPNQDEGFNKSRTQHRYSYHIILLAFKDMGITK